MSGNKLVDLLNQYTHEHTIMETGKVIGIKPITTGQMKSILRYEGEENSSVVEKILDELINGCVTTEEFSLDNLTLQDRFDLLIAIRKATKGDLYSFNWKCTECGDTSIQAVNLNDLELKPFPTDIDNKVKVSERLTLNLDFIRRGDQKESEQLVENIKGLTDYQKVSETATYMYAFGIKDVESNVGKLEGISIQDKVDFLNQLGEKEYNLINDWYNKYNYGTEFKTTLKCRHCGHEEELALPLTGFFF